LCLTCNHLGCSLVEAFSDCDGKKQDLPGGTIPWDAPEEKKALSGLNLRRTDIYSYGLLVWRIVCNGNEPFDDLPWDDDLELAKAVPTEEEGRILTKRERFVRLKSKRNWVKRLARDSLLNRHHGDVRVESIDAVMNVALEMDPSRRANDMDEIVILLSGGETVSSGNVPEVAPAPLMKGEFGINSPSVGIKLMNLHKTWLTDYSFPSRFIGFEIRLQHFDQSFLNSWQEIRY
jgi:serine/threonine protein kinase